MRWGIATCCALLVLMSCIVLTQPGSGSSSGVAFGASSQPVTASVPPLIRFSGTLTGVQSGTQTVVFSLYDSPQADAPLWSETQQVDIDEQGAYTVTLGSSRPEGMPLNLFSSGRALWLGVEVAGEVEQPRTMLVAVPYAFKAAEAETLGGLPVSAFMLAPQPGSPAAPGAGPSGSEPGSASATSGGPAAATAAGATVPLVTPCGSLESDGTGSANQLVKFSAPCNTTKSAVFESGGKVGIGTTTPAGTLDVVGGALVRGTLQLPAKGTAAAAAGFTSQPEDWQASVFKSGAPLTEHFLWQAEPVGNDTAAASAKLSLLSAAGVGSPAETGLSISSKGLITFAAGQKFPGAGPGTITGVTAGTDLSGGGTSGSVTLNLNTALTDARYARLAAANSFTGNQSITGNLGATGTLTGSQLKSTVATGTSPLSITSTTQVPNLNASLLGGMAAAAFAKVGANSFSGNQTVTGNVAASGNVTGKQLVSTATTGTPPLSVTSTTEVPNLNAGLLDGLGASAFAQLAAPNSFTANQSIGGSLTVSVTSGTAITAFGQYGVTGNGLATAASFGTGGTGLQANGGIATGSSSSGGTALIASGGSGVSADGDGAHIFGGGSGPQGGIGVLVYGGSGTTAGNAVIANGGQSSDGSSNGVGLIATGGANLGVSVSGGADAIQATGGAGKQSAGGNGVTSTGGAGGGTGTLGGTGVSATGGSNSGAGFGGAGVLGTGGGASTASGTGGDGADGNGGAGFFGGSGLSGIGGDASGASGGNGGIGVLADGGPADLAIGVGGDGVQSTGGNAAHGGDGVLAYGGSAASASGGTGGPGAYLQGGSADMVSGTGGDGIYAYGGAGHIPGFAAYLGGNVQVTGTLTADKLVAATTKDFKIEDPVDPTKYLFHASVESSEIKNIYDGVVVMDHRGEAVVKLPRWFEALNGNFRYQLTCIGGWAPVCIKRKIDGNQFTIAGGTSGLEVSWQLTGVRHDAAAKAHPLVVEVAKNDDPSYQHEMARAKLKASGAHRHPNPTLTAHHPG